MIEGESADMYIGKFLLVLIGGRGKGLVWVDLEARTFISASGIFIFLLLLLRPLLCTRK